MRPRAPSLEAFDPTPEEEAAAERAKPLKTPLCLRCKLHPRLSTVSGKELSDAFLQISSVLTSERAGTLTRMDVERLRTAHMYLTRANKGWYCRGCFDATIEFANDLTAQASSRVAHESFSIARNR